MGQPVGPPFGWCRCGAGGSGRGVCAAGVRVRGGGVGGDEGGGGLVPLDPVYPPARLAHVIGHARPRVVITTDELAGRVEVASPTIVVDGDVGGEGDADLVVGDERVGVGVEIDEHDLAYVIYTSSSTGVPKVVEIEHHSLMNLIGWHNTAYSIVPHDRASQIASVGFDAAVWEIWPYLAARASVHTATDDIRADPDLLIDWLDDQQITIAFIPTPLAETLLDKPWPATSTLHHLLTGGDTLHRQPNPDTPTPWSTITDRPRPRSWPPPPRRHDRARAGPLVSREHRQPDRQHHLRDHRPRRPCRRARPERRVTHGWTRPRTRLPRRRRADQPTFHRRPHDHDDHPNHGDHAGGGVTPLRHR